MEGKERINNLQSWRGKAVLSQFTTYPCAFKAKGELKNYSIIFEGQPKRRGKKKLAMIVLGCWARLPGLPPAKPRLRPDHPLPSWEHPEKAAACPSLLPIQEASPTPSSREGERGGRNELSGCGPRLREPTQGPATARKPPDSPPAWRAQALLPETARIRAHCLCTTRSSREVEPEEEGRGDEGWGEGRPASSPSASPWKLPLGF